MYSKLNNYNLLEEKKILARLIRNVPVYFAK